MKKVFEAKELLGMRMEVEGLDAIGTLVGIDTTIGERQCLLILINSDVISNSSDVLSKALLRNIELQTCARKKEKLFLIDNKDNLQKVANEEGSFFVWCTEDDVVGIEFEREEEEQEKEEVSDEEFFNELKEILEIMCENPEELRKVFEKMEVC